MTETGGTLKTIPTNKSSYTVLSLGAGVQSSTLALMSAAGEVRPLPDFAVFADTQAEPADVYRWLEWLKSQLPFPVIVATKGDLAAESCRVRTAKAGNTYTKHGVPAFMFVGADTQGPMMRQCTGDFKIDVIHRAIRQTITGHRTKSVRKGVFVSQWIGISVDEVFRMKDSRLGWIKNRWPLLENGLTRADCLQWMQARGFPTPPRSSCVFCPYHNDAEWHRLKTTAPADFARAVTFERNYQAALAQVPRFYGTPYLHASGKPLAQIEFKPGDTTENFSHECEGICGN